MSLRPKSVSDSMLQANTMKLNLRVDTSVWSLARGRWLQFGLRYLSGLIGEAQGGVPAKLKTVVDHNENVARIDESDIDGLGTISRDLRKVWKKSAMYCEAPGWVSWTVGNATTCASEYLWSVWDDSGRYPRCTG